VKLPFRSAEIVLDFSTSVIVAFAKACPDVALITFPVILPDWENETVGSKINNTTKYIVLINIFFAKEKVYCVNHVKKLLSKYYFLQITFHDLITLKNNPPGVK